MVVKLLIQKSIWIGKFRDLGPMEKTLIVRRLDSRTPKIPCSPNETMRSMLPGIGY
jgi:hypothetical protein